MQEEVLIQEVGLPDKPLSVLDSTSSQTDVREARDDRVQGPEMLFPVGHLSDAALSMGTDARRKQLVVCKECHTARLPV